MAELILVIDDNAVNAKLMRVVLIRAGYEVEVAEDAPSARLAIARRRPDLVLMDLQLPGTDGLSLTRELKSRPDTADIPVVAVTAYAMRGDDQRALAAGCSGYVTKPIDTRTFVATVTRHLSSISK